MHTVRWVISKTSCWVKEDTYKRVHTVWFYLYEMLEKTNVIYSDRKQIGDWSQKEKWGLTGTKQRFWMMELHPKLIMVVAIWMWKKVKVEVVQSCLILCDPMDYTVHGILQARILEWVAFPFSRGSSQLGKGLNLGLPHHRGILY